MSEANTRGEVTIDLDATYVLRPSFAAIMAAEKATGKSLIQLHDEAATGTMSLETAGILVCEMIKAWGREYREGDDIAQRHAANSNAKRVTELVYDSGLFAVSARLVVVLRGAVTGGVTVSGEWKEPANKAQTPAAG